MLVQAKTEVSIPEHKVEIAVQHGLAALKKVKFVESLPDLLFTGDKGALDVTRDKFQSLYKAYQSILVDAFV